MTIEVVIGKSKNMWTCQNYDQADSMRWYS